MHIRVATRLLQLSWVHFFMPHVYTRHRSRPAVAQRALPHALFQGSTHVRDAVVSLVEAIIDVDFVLVIELILM